MAFHFFLDTRMEDVVLFHKLGMTVSSSSSADLAIATSGQVPTISAVGVHYLAPNSGSIDKL